jgi:hypothetical protein
LRRRDGIEAVGGAKDEQRARKGRSEGILSLLAITALACACIASREID